MDETFSSYIQGLYEKTKENTGSSSSTGNGKSPYHTPDSSRSNSRVSNESLDEEEDEEESSEMIVDSIPAAATTTTMTKMPMKMPRSQFQQPPPPQQQQQSSKEKAQKDLEEKLTRSNAEHEKMHAVSLRASEELRKHLEKVKETLCAVELRQKEIAEQEKILAKREEVLASREKDFLDRVKDLQEREKKMTTELEEMTKSRSQTVAKSSSSSSSSSMTSEMKLVEQILANRSSMLDEETLRRIVTEEHMAHLYYLASVQKIALQTLSHKDDDYIVVIVIDAVSKAIVYQQIRRI